MASIRTKNKDNNNKRPYEELHHVSTIDNSPSYIKSIEEPLKKDMLKQFYPSELVCGLTLKLVLVTPKGISIVIT